MYMQWYWTVLSVVLNTNLFCLCDDNKIKTLWICYLFYESTAISEIFYSTNAIACLLCNFLFLLFFVSSNFGSDYFWILSFDNSIKAEKIIYLPVIIILNGFLSPVFSDFIILEQYVKFKPSLQRSIVWMHNAYALAGGDKDFWQKN